MAEPISLFVPAGIIAALSLPLALRLVPPNRFYGIRSARTMADRETWFSVNRVGGFALMLAAGVALGAYVLDPELASGRSFLGVLTLIVPVIAALLATGVYSRRLARCSTGRSLRMASIEGKVVQCMGGGSCQVVTSNSIAIAFTPSAEFPFKLDDRFRFTGLLEGDDAPVTVENLTRGWSVQMVIGAHNVHDLRVPMKHGGSRTPSVQRLHGE